MLFVYVCIIHLLYLEIRYPERGRKPIHASKHTLRTTYLEIRYPERGRKQQVHFFNVLVIRFGNKIPREGTETRPEGRFEKASVEFGNKIPREGTETGISTKVLFLMASYLEIRYPKRGRKPFFKLHNTKHFLVTHLEIRYPERGRKRISSARYKS